MHVLIPQVIYLRRFKNLHTVNLSGNPLSEDENYKLFIAAYLSDLVYLDYRLLNEETVSSNPRQNSRLAFDSGLSLVQRMYHIHQCPSWLHPEWNSNCEIYKKKWLHTVSVIFPIGSEFTPPLFDSDSPMYCVFAEAAGLGQIPICR